MKNNIYKISKLLVLAIVLFSACTDDFEEYNTNKNGITDEMLKADFRHIGGFLPQMQKSIYYNPDNSNWKFQLQQNLNSDVYSGYLMPPTPFKEGKNNTNYALVDWNNWPFSLAFENIMSPWLEIRKKTETEFKDFYGIALILKVAGMHRVTDIYGPIPYTKYGQGGVSVSYDSQESIYKEFFKELDEGVKLVDEYVKKYPDAKPIKEYDVIFGGDYTKWLKWANSLRLRLAVRIAMVNPTLAKAEAEKASSNSYGFLSGNENVLVNDPKMGHPLIEIANSWKDARMGANMESIMVGLNDPRLEAYWSKANDAGLGIVDQYKGIRYGIDIEDKNDRINYSTLGPSFAKSNKFNQPIQLMTVAEVYFLRAEAALRGWSGMLGDATNVQDLYEMGIKASLDQWGLGSKLDAYKNDDANMPINYVDPKDAGNNINAVSTVKVKWSDAASNEEKLEKIITQKWIAMFPEGQEAWSEFRRTGYPKLFPMKANYSGGTIDSDILIRRLPFTHAEYRDNAAEVAKATQLLKGGVDNGGTRLWWDTGSNF